jgi:iron complex outermembrane recepter protein
MYFKKKPLAAALTLLCAGTVAWADEATTTALSEVVVSADRLNTPVATDSVAGEGLAKGKASTSDTAGLLSEVPGVALSTAGGVSSLPIIHGLADDRIRTRIDGMDLISACANHMNSPLSYIDPTNVESITVYPGISPVSAGGDSLGSTIVVKSKSPSFAAPGEGLLKSGEVGTYYRSNGDAWGVHAAATIASDSLSLSYNGSTTQSENYHSAKSFKSTITANGTLAGQHVIDGDEVASTAYKTENQQLDLAYRFDKHLFDLKLGYQHIPYQGFPNQHMDMTDNRSTQINLGYSGEYDWGKLEARVYNEHTRHEMNFADDKLYWYSGANVPCSPVGSTCVQGMQMDTEGHNSGLALKGEVPLSARDLLRIGSEYQRYRLDDWWDPSGGGMWPMAFININNGKRDHFDLYGEWEAQWDSRWQTLLGARGSTVWMDTGAVHGYNTTSNNYATESAAFNARDRSRTDNNLDLSAIARYTADATSSYSGGYARKTRSPSLYERYTWSTGGMAMAMNNWVNDGNGYVGNMDLKPEVAHTVSFTADWHDPTRNVWGLQITPYFSYVNDYIDAKRCYKAGTTTCTTANGNATNKYVYLTLDNEDARLYGIDVSGFFPVATGTGFGDFTGRAQLSYVNGENRETGDNLYNIMPLNARLVLEQRIGNWTNSVESVLVTGKHDVSAVRNEMETSGYGLLNLRSSYDVKRYRIDLGIENLFNQQYSLPLGGAYIGQGKTMSLGSTTSWTSTGNPPWGYVVPGMGRSLYAGVTMRF